VWRGGAPHSLRARLQKYKAKNEKDQATIAQLTAELTAALSVRLAIGRSSVPLVLYLPALNCM
jgi:hypothetical protein